MPRGKGRRPQTSEANTGAGKRAQPLVEPEPEAGSSSSSSDEEDNDLPLAVANGFGVLNDAKKLAAAKKDGQKRRAASKKKQAKAQAPPCDTDFDYILVVDFECTCEKNDNDYPHEIIEFPVVVIDCKAMKVTEKWRQYVRPVKNPTLTAFCKDLTKITQAQVDASQVLSHVLQDLHVWLHKAGLLDEGVTFAFATDGPWDFREFYFNHAVVQQRAVGVHYPYFDHWIDVRRAFFHATGNGGNLKSMLRYFKLPFIGQPHSGLDDSFNIAQVLLAVLKAGARVDVNSRVDDETAQFMRNNLKPIPSPAE